MGIFETALSASGFNRHSAAIIRREDGVPAGHPFTPEIRSMFDSASGISAAGIFSLGETPVACLVDSSELTTDAGLRTVQLRRFCERLWNQNLVSVVLVIEEHGVQAFSVLDPAAPPEYVKDFGEGSKWSPDDFISGRVWERNDHWFDPALRVDKTLLDNISALIEKLQGLGLKAESARAAVARVIFVSYLEHRGIVSDTYRARYQVGNLNTLIGSKDRAGLKELFSRLKDDFNGDFLTIKENDAAALWSLSDQSLGVLKDFLDRSDLKSGQRSFWRYDFGEIPIELISAIYETFLSNKDKQESEESDVEKAKITKRQLGAYYTPRKLALYVIEQAFEGVEAPLTQKIFDGACGSGILLTTAFRRIMKISEDQLSRSLDFDERCNLLCQNIFGGDIDEDACRLTAFSLYLAVLSDLQPSDLSRLQERGGKLPNLLGNNIRWGKKSGDIFSQESVGETSGKYTLFISNPPWREPESEEATSYEDWLGTLSPCPRVPLRQIAAAFAFRAADCLAEGGSVTLVLPASLFVGKIASGFRTDLLEWLNISKIVNFADMRRLIFPGAKHPFVVVSGRARSPSNRIAPESGEFIDYLVPKADISLAFGRLAVHGSDRIRLPSWSIAGSELILALRYWATEHDLSLFRRCGRLGRVADLIKERKWLVNSGFTAAYRNSPRLSPGWLKDFDFLDAASIPADTPILDESRVIVDFPDTFSEIAYFGERQIYAGPKLVWPDGADPDVGVRAIYSEKAFCFRHGVKGVTCPAEDRDVLRFLTAYLRSPLAKYFLILLSHSVSGERPKLHINEFEAMPFVHPDSHPNKDRAWEIIRSISRIFDRLFETPEGFREAFYAHEKPHLDALVKNYFMLTEEECALVTEMVEVVAKSIQPSSTKKADLLTPFLSYANKPLVDSYCRRLESALTEWSKGSGGSGALHVTAAYDRKRLMGAAVISLAIQDEPDQDIDVLSIISESIKNTASSSLASKIMTMPNIIVAEGKKILLIKPLRTRFWLQRTALSDADTIVEHIRAASKMRGNSC